jgi:hypothetical protein
VIEAPLCSTATRSLDGSPALVALPRLLQKRKRVRRVENALGRQPLRDTQKRSLREDALAHIEIALRIDITAPLQAPCGVHERSNIRTAGVPAPRKHETRECGEKEERKEKGKRGLKFRLSLSSSKSDKVNSSAVEESLSLAPPEDNKTKKSRI